MPCWLAKDQLLAMSARSGRLATPILAGSLLINLLHLSGGSRRRSDLRLRTEGALEKQLLVFAVQQQSLKHNLLRFLDRRPELARLQTIRLRNCAMGYLEAKK